MAETPDNDLNPIADLQPVGVDTVGLTGQEKSILQELEALESELRASPVMTDEVRAALDQVRSAISNPRGLTKINYESLKTDAKAAVAGSYAEYTEQLMTSSYVLSRDAAAVIDYRRMHTFAEDPASYMATFVDSSYSAYMQQAFGQTASRAILSSERGAADARYIDQHHDVATAVTVDEEARKAELQRMIDDPRYAAYKGALEYMMRTEAYKTEDGQKAVDKVKTDIEAGKQPTGEDIDYVYSQGWHGEKELRENSKEFRQLVLDQLPDQYREALAAVGDPCTDQGNDAIRNRYHEIITDEKRAAETRRLMEQIENGQIDINDLPPEKQQDVAAMRYYGSEMAVQGFEHLIKEVRNYVELDLKIKAEMSAGKTREEALAGLSPEERDFYQRIDKLLEAEGPERHELVIKMVQEQARQKGRELSREEAEVYANAFEEKFKTGDDILAVAKSTASERAAAVSGVMSSVYKGTATQKVVEDALNKAIEAAQANPDDAYYKQLVRIKESELYKSQEGAQFTQDLIKNKYDEQPRVADQRIDDLLDAKVKASAPFQAAILDEMQAGVKDVLKSEMIIGYDRKLNATKLLEEYEKLPEWKDSELKKYTHAKNISEIPDELKREYAIRRSAEALITVTSFVETNTLAAKISEQKAAGGVISPDEEKLVEAYAVVSDKNNSHEKRLDALKDLMIQQDPELAKNKYLLNLAAEATISAIDKSEGKPLLLDGVYNQVNEARDARRQQHEERQMTARRIDDYVSMKVEGKDTYDSDNAQEQQAIKDAVAKGGNTAVQKELQKALKDNNIDTLELANILLAAGVTPSSDMLKDGLTMQEITAVLNTPAQAQQMAKADTAGKGQ